MVYGKYLLANNQLRLKVVFFRPLAEYGLSSPPKGEFCRPYFS